MVRKREEEETDQIGGGRGKKWGRVEGGVARKRERKRGRKRREREDGE